MVAIHGTANGKGWYLAPSLVALLGDANQVAPHRSTVSDGTIGDTAHQARHSDHNPDGTGCVAALDLTNDPAHGFDSWDIARRIASAISAGTETRVAYLISGDPGRRGDLIFHQVGRGWQWDPHPHTNGSHNSHHLHVSVATDPFARSSISPWPIFATRPPTPTENDLMFLIQRGPGGPIAATNFVTKRALGPAQLAAFRDCAKAAGMPAPVTVVANDVYDAIPG